MAIGEDLLGRLKLFYNRLVIPSLSVLGSLLDKVELSAFAGLDLASRFY